MKMHAVRIVKAAALGLLCSVIANVVTVRSSAQSVIDNGDFESSGGGVATDWNFVADNPPTVSTTVVHGGTASVRTYAQTDADGAGHSSEANQPTVFNTLAPVAAVPGQSYTLSMWMHDVPSSEYPDGYTSVGAISAVILIWTDASGITIGGNVLSHGPFFPGQQANWTQFQATGLVAPANTVNVLIQLISSTGANTNTAGGMYFDDITLTTAGGGGGGSTNRVPSAIAIGTQVGWTASAANNYQPQKSTDNSTWTSIGSGISGNSVTSVFENATSPFYRVLEYTTGSGGTGSVLNGGFETPGSDPTNAASWTVVQHAGGPALWYGRTNDSPHSGAFEYEIHIAASPGQGPVVAVQQSGIPVTGGTTIPFTFYAKLLTGSAGASTQWRVIWDQGGETGFHAYTPGANVYSLVSNSVVVPANATAATVFFYTPGAADTNQTATLMLDDITLGAGGGGGGSAGTNTLSATVQHGARISWASSNGINYAVQSTPEVSTTTWSTVTTVPGNGGTLSIVDSATGQRKFYQVLTQ